MKARRTHGKTHHLALPTFLLLPPSVYLSVFFVRASLFFVLVFSPSQQLVVAAKKGGGF